MPRSARAPAPRPGRWPGRRGRASVADLVRDVDRRPALDLDERAAAASAGRRTGSVALHPERAIAGGRPGRSRPARRPSSAGRRRRARRRRRRPRPGRGARRRPRADVAGGPAPRRRPSPRSGTSRPRTGGRSGAGRGRRRTSPSRGGRSRAAGRAPAAVRRRRVGAPVGVGAGGRGRHRVGSVDRGARRPVRQYRMTLVTR